MNRLIVTLFFAVLTLAVYAQGQADIFSTPPPTPNEYGKCYAKCKTPDVYETVSSQIITKEGAAKSTTSKATYTTATEQVLVKEGYKKYSIVPARFEKSTKRVLASDGGCTVAVVPAKYSSNSTRQLVSAASGKWVRKKKAPNCLSANPEDCYVLCWEEIPAQYTTSSTRVLVDSERYDTVYTDAKYTTVTTQSLVNDASVSESYTPPVYKTVTKKVLAQCGGVSTVYSQPQYKTVSKKVLVSQGSFTDWAEVVCAGDVNSSLVTRVQTALNSRGYSAGSVDGVMGGMTRAALAKFQKDNGLPLGNLNIATMQALDVK
jgi:OOP family OmpA-OmpF porin